MKTYFNSFFLALSLLISCGGSKSDVNDSLMSGNVSQTSNLNQGNTNIQGNNSSNQTNTSYSFNNELVWSDEFDENSLSGATVSIFHLSEETAGAPDIEFSSNSSLQTSSLLKE